MTCEELNALLAEGAELPEEGTTHLAACANCRAAAQRWAAVRQGLAARAGAGPSWCFGGGGGWWALSSALGCSS